MQRAAVKYTTLTFRKSCKATRLKVIGHARIVLRNSPLDAPNAVYIYTSVTVNSRHFAARTTSVLAASA